MFSQASTVALPLQPSPPPQPPPPLSLPPRAPLPPAINDLFPQSLYFRMPFTPKQAGTSAPSQFDWTPPPRQRASTLFASMLHQPSSSHSSPLERSLMSAFDEADSDELSSALRVERERVAQLVGQVEAARKKAQLEELLKSMKPWSGREVAVSRPSSAKRSLTFAAHPSLSNCRPLRNGPTLENEEVTLATAKAANLCSDAYDLEQRSTKRNPRHASLSPAADVRCVACLRLEQLLVHDPDVWCMTCGHS